MSFHFDSYEHSESFRQTTKVIGDAFINSATAQNLGIGLRLAVQEVPTAVEQVASTGSKLVTTIAALATADTLMDAFPAGLSSLEITKAVAGIAVTAFSAKSVLQAEI